MNKFYDAEIDNMTMEAPKLIMDEGDWKLYDFNGDDDTHETSSLWHECDMDGADAACDGPAKLPSHTGLWPVRYMDYIETDNLTIEHVPHAWKCVYCYKTPPDKILTLFLLHNFDRLAK